MNDFKQFKESNISRFLEQQQIIDKCKILENYNWPEYKKNDDANKYANSIQKIFVENLGFFPVISKPIKLRKWGLNIFRVRIFDDIKNHESIKEYSYPPSEVTVLNRCNFPKIPVFYGSHNANAAMLEVIREYNFKGKRLALTVWKVKDMDGELKYENFLNSGLHPDSFYNHFPNKLKSNLESIFGNDDNLIDAIIEYRKFIEAQFIKDNDYTLSASLAYNRLFSKGKDRTDILMYPSVQSKGYETNFAINPSFVDNHLELHRIYTVTLPSLEIGKENFALNFENFADVFDGKVVWREIDENGLNLTKVAREDFGEEVSFTKQLK